MNTSDDEPSSGLNGRLRPRKSNVSSPLLPTTKVSRKPESKAAQEKPKRTSTPSKAPNKTDGLTNKPESSPVLHLLCPYCDKKFASKQTISKHVRRMHSFTTKQDSLIACLFCNHTESELNDIIRHMVDSHPNQYFACLDCHTRFPSTAELAEHKLNVCEKQKLPYRSKLRRKSRGAKKSQKSLKIDGKDFRNDIKTYSDGHGFNGIVISCELKPSQVHDEADIEDNITTNLILPPSKSLGNSTVLDKNAVIVLDDIQWNKRIPSNFSFHNTDADQILSRLGVVHRSPRAGESTRRDWLRTIDDSTQKFEKCFDTSFYSKVASNVQENLTKFLDGSFNFNPDPDNTIKTRKSKNSVVINTAEGFPILLACEQFSRNTFDGYMPRAVAPKHKWKWDNLENDRIAISADQIKRDSHTNNCIITLVSSLDIWTQLCMRRKYEEKYGYSPLVKKTDKQTAIDKELKEILESREIPTSSSQVVKYNDKILKGDELDFPASLGLTPSTPKYDMTPAVLSGEWVRPRCFVCCACGSPTSDSRALSAHMATHHPIAQVQHYEVVGELLLNSDILKHLYVPPSQMYNRTRPLRGFRECTKCKKSITLEDLHQHMLDCAGDTPTVRRKCRYRPFGVRKRRHHLPDSRIHKKMHKGLRNRQHRQKTHMRPRPRNRSDVGDAETIRKMLADLPAKRHRVLVNPMNPILRPRKKLDKQRNKLLIKRRSSEDRKNRKLRTVKNNGAQSVSTANEGNGKNQPIFNDDDEPLKPLKSVTKKVTQQSDVAKRKTVLNRAKRKVHQKKQIPIDNVKGPDTNVTCPTDVLSEQLSIDNTPQRIDVNDGSYNTREHSNRDGSNNREHQRPSANDQNGNSNNSCVPVQNAPLKHSIASLTADSETHDKSVQFHHLFLVQQECNNINQHVASEHRLLFENEAAVTRLDKPPLTHGKRGSLDPYAFQKNKLNKPRKGLNDCIAMLKNKLVEPTSCLNSTQMSVQCGGDDPLDSEPAVGLQRTEINVPTDATLKPAEVFSRHNINLPPDISLKKSFDNHTQDESPSQKATQISPVHHDSQKMHISKSSRNESSNTKSKSSKQKTNEVNTKRESTRRRTSTRSVVNPSQLKQLELLPQIVAAQHKQSQLLSLSASQEKSGRVSQRRSSSQQIVVNINTECNKNLPIDIQNKISPRQSIEIHTEPILIKSNKIEISPNVPASKVSSIDKSQTEANIKSKAQTRLPSQTPYTARSPRSQPMSSSQSQPLIQLQLKSIQAPSVPLLHSQSQIQTHPPPPATPPESPPLPSTGLQVVLPLQTEQQTKSVMKTWQTMYHDTATGKSSNISGECNATRKMSMELYQESELTHIPSDIPPAHASTIIDSLVSVPLDLSGKTTNIENLDCASKHEKPFNSNYDNYETLDLSNKNNDIVNKAMNSVTDIVVDLRVKPTTQPQSQENTVDLCAKISNNEVVANLSKKNDDVVPTDLSVRAKCIDLHVGTSVNKNYCIQDLSGHTNITSIIDNDIQPVIDLSGRPADFISETNKTDPNTCKEILLPLTEDEQQDFCDMPADLSGKTGKIKQSNLTPDLQKSSSHTETSDSNENQENNDKNISLVVQSLVTDKGSVQKPVYDPTLKIPQYKIRTSLTSPPTSSVQLKDSEPMSSTKLEKKLQLPPVTETTSGYLLPRVIPQDVINTSYNASVTQGRMYDSSSTSVDGSISTVVCSLPAFTLPSPVMTTVVSKHESTIPVYTLANACISITKVERPNQVPLTSSLLSIPSTTIVNTTSVYTLAGTTIGAPMNYGTLSNTGFQIPAPNSFQPVTSPSNNLINEMHFTNNKDRQIRKSEDSCGTIDSNPEGNAVDQDPETARKIAMLPKELVEILGTMPPGHRNQLLNVLPQYVSTTTTSSNAHIENTHVSTNTSISESASSPTVTCKQSPSERNIPSVNNSRDITPLNITLSSSLDHSSVVMHMSTPQICITEADLKHLKDVAVLHTTQSLSKISLEESKSDLFINSQRSMKKEIINTDISDSHTDETISQTVIDLTEDDNLPSIKALKTTEDIPQKTVFSSQVNKTLVVLPNAPKQKVNNEKTSILRAVRIKAPSERQKSISTENFKQKQSVEQQTRTYSSQHETEPDALNKCLAIQQSEVSSTQQHKKNVAETKIPSLVSPCRRDSNSDHLKDYNTQLLFNEQSKILKETSKSVLVTSSISTLDSVHNESVEQTMPEKVDAKINLDVVNNETESFNEIPMNNQTNSDYISSENKVSDCIAKSPISFEDLLEENQNNIKTNSTLMKISPHEEDDSEDDISLAVIVKQKQLDLQNVDDNIDESLFSTQEHKNNCSQKKKKKENRGKRSDKKGTQVNVSIEGNSEAPKVTKLPCEISLGKHDFDCNLAKKITADLETKNNPINKGKRSKKNTIKDNHNTVNTKEPELKERSEPVIVMQLENEIDTVNIRSTVSDIYNNVNNDVDDVTTIKQTTAIFEDTKMTQSLANENQGNDLENKLNYDDDHFNDKKISVREKWRDMPLDTDQDITNDDFDKDEEKDKTKKSTSTIVSELCSDQVNIVLKQQENHSNSLTPTKESLEPFENNVTSEIDRNTDSCPYSIMELSDTQDSTPALPADSNSRDESIETSAEIKRNKRFRTKKSRKIDFANDSSQCSERDERVVTPLRRSRRGKSLFVESMVAETESIISHSEMSAEQKTPLTKKQLIFSKLLLDEENTKPQAQSTPVKEIIEKNNDTDEIIRSPTEISSQIDFKPKQEKSKPVKRRQSPQIRRKSKIRKSYETESVIDDVDQLNDFNDHSGQIEFAPRSMDANQNIREGTEESQKRETALGVDISVNMSEISTAEVNAVDAIPKFCDKNLSSAEKRKIVDHAELRQSPKPKKCKSDTKQDTIATNNKLREDTSIIKQTQISSTEVRTACYNLPVAARRTRSKSAVVKPSDSLFYDPYDIDLDDMIDKNEPIFTKKGKTSECKVGNSHTIKNPHSTEEFSKTRKKEIIPDKLFEIHSKKHDSICDDDNVEGDKNDVSDSDDSSKSDVPLKKYVEEKEKKNLELDNNILLSRDEDDEMEQDESDINDDKGNSSDSKLIRRTLGVCNSSESAVQNEAEEQLRSEQFMESFGFFSERKPRKSNLLASKKISETFHIIANESDDIYFGVKDRSPKKLLSENRKSSDAESSKTAQLSSNKKATKRGRKKRSCVKPEPCYCNICKKEFRRPDNYLRHQMSLLHISKLSEIEMKIKTLPIHEEPNYLIAYKQYLDRLKILTDKLAKKKKNSKAAKKIKLPTVEEILADLNKTIREQQLSQRGLSRDEALFLDCCELLKESHKSEINTADSSALTRPPPCSATGLELSEKSLTDDKFDTKSDGDVDSITAKNILESEEVRNLENDLISGLKEAANASLNSKMNYQIIAEEPLLQDPVESFSSPILDDTQYETIDEYEVVVKTPENKPKKYPEYKEKMYPDIIEDIDMFEDKFDKIKRKCRSQAAAAKQTQAVIEPSVSHKGRKKSDKKKGKKIKKNYQSTHVLTKGALKGFDGIKVSIPTSDINMSAIVPPNDLTSKKKKKTNSKKKRDKKDSESSSKHDNDQRPKDSGVQKKVDVYEFMDNEDAELFEFRPSTLMERFKSISNKELPSTSKFNPAPDEVDISSESVSDGDDFVYMSDDYVCSDDETENSLMSCEMGKGGTDAKKTSSPLKRKDVVEKNAVMGKIFKHNAVRTEKRSSKSKETVKPKANLDQLFDSLLEDEPSSSTIKSDVISPRKERSSSPKSLSQSSNFELLSVSIHDDISPSKEFLSPQKMNTSPPKCDSTVLPTSSKKHRTTPTKDFRYSPTRYESVAVNKYDSLDDYGPSTSKRFEGNVTTSDYAPSTSKTYDASLLKDCKTLSPKKYESTVSKKKDFAPSKSVSPKYITTSTRTENTLKKFDSLDRPPSRKEDEGISTSFDYGVDDQTSFDDTGVARQRARRKCTVGKQNVLAESWSSESEPDGGPPRPTSAESVLANSGRKKKGRKREGQQSSGRRGNNRQITFKKQDVESRVTSSNRNTSSNGANSIGAGSSPAEGYSSSGSGTGGKGAGGSSSTSVSTGVQVSLGPPAYPGPSGLKGRPRPAAYNWTSEGDEEQEHLQQHGWIVGDSHKKLVTMLAHAKGRKRNNDDKRHLVE